MIPTNRLRASLIGWRRKGPFHRTAVYHRLLCVIALMVLLVLPGATSNWAQASPPSEYQVKAAFIYNFAKFVDWPADAFTDEKSPFALCVYGKDPFGSTLDDTTRGKTIGTREFVVRRTRKIQDLSGCQIVFVSDSESEHLPEILAGLHGTSALLIGESPHFAEQGGQIQFVPEGKRIRFSINVDSVNRAHIRMSSKLLALAQIVHDTK